METSMLKANNFPNEYWVEGVACLVYILNIYPTKSIKDKIPLDTWRKMNTTGSHPRLFGCVAYAHIPKEMRKKLDDKSEKYIFVGYNLVFQHLQIV